MSSQEDTVAEFDNSQNSIGTSISFTSDDVYALLDSHQYLEAKNLISAIKKFIRGTKMAQKNVKALDALCDRLLASVTTAPTLSSIVERLDAIDAKISAPQEVTKLSYAAVVANVPPEAQPKRPTRSDEVAIKISRDTAAGAQTQGSGVEMKDWVEKAIRSSGVKGLSMAGVLGVQPHRSGAKVMVRFQRSEDAEQVIRHAAKCSTALGPGAKISVPHYGVVIQDVPLYYDPGDATNRADLHAQNPSLLPSPTSVVEARWLVPKERLPSGRKCGSWVVFLDSKQAADNLIDQGVRVQSLLLNACRYFSGPRQCRKCQRWGHLSYSCREATQICAHCGGPHHGRECPSPETKRCVNCSGLHDSFSPLCPSRRTETLRAQSSQAGASVYFAGSDFTFSPFPLSE